VKKPERREDRNMGSVPKFSANEAIEELSRALITAMSIEEVSSLVLEQAKRLTDSVHGYAGYIDIKTGYLIVPAMAGDIWGICQVEDKDAVFKEFSGLWGWVLKNRAPLLTNAASDDSRSSATLEGYILLRRFLSVPSIMGGILVGQIALANSDREYTEQDLAVVERLSALYALAIQRKWEEEERERLIRRLQEAIASIKTLQGMLPICASCKKIRDDKGYWTQIEEYIRDHSGTEFSHGICPECMKKLYGDIMERDADTKKDR
jgi:GAF domain-containing protein